MSDKKATFYRGNLHLDALSAAGLPTGQRLEVNLTALTLAPPDSSKIVVPDQSVAGYGNTLASVTVPGGTPATVTLTADAIPEDQWDLWLSGTQSTLTQSAGTSVAFEVAANLDRWVPLGNDHVELTALTLAAPVDKVLGTDYEVDYQGGRIRALASGTIVQGATMSGTYNHAAITSPGGIVHGGSVLSRNCYIYFVGKNLAHGERVILDIWQAELTFGEAQPVSDGFMSLTATGPMITPPGKTSPYRRRKWAAPA